MATRTRRTTTPGNTAPAKQTAAKTPAKKTTTRKAAAKKPTLTVVPDQPATVIDLRKPLKARRGTATGPYTAAQLTEARACLASATAQLPVPHLLWLTQPNGQAAARLTDDTLLIHTHHRAPEFTAILRCPTGGLHTELVTNHQDLKAARTITGTCTRRHDDTEPEAGGYDWHKAITLGVKKVVPARLSPLNAGLQAVKKATADTQPLPLDDIAEGLTERATSIDTEEPKEHPEP